MINTDILSDTEVFIQANLNGYRSINYQPAPDELEIIIQDDIEAYFTSINNVLINVIPLQPDVKSGDGATFKLELELFFDIKINIFDLKTIETYLKTRFIEIF